MIKTRWNIWIANQPNQHELLKIAAGLFAEQNIVIKKLSYIPENANIQVTFPAGAAPLAESGEPWQKIRDNFNKLTGAQLINA
jgi:hypothetical protein